MMVVDSATFDLRLSILERSKAIVVGRMVNKATKRIAKAKFSFTHGIVPKKNPAKTNTPTHKNEPMTLASKKREYFIFESPAINGTNVRNVGTNLDTSTAFTPCLR